MGKIVVFCLFVVNVLIASGNIQAIDKMVDSIKKPRKGLDVSTFGKLKDPFIVATMNTDMSEVVISEVKKPIPNFSLSAIINHQAYINGAWHNEGEKIEGYNLRFVGSRGVVLTYEKRIVKLFLPEKNQNTESVIKITEGGN